MLKSNPNVLEVKRAMSVYKALVRGVTTLFVENHSGLVASMVTFVCAILRINVLR